MLRKMKIPALLALALAMHGGSEAQAQYAGRNRVLIDEAARELGVRPSRLTTRQVSALEAAFPRLFPTENPRRYTLNRSQATALVYLALVHPRGTRGPGWDDRDRDRYDEWDRDRGRDGGWDDERPGGSRSALTRRECQEITTRAYEAANVIDAEGSSLFLDSGEKEQVRTLLREVQRIAASRGETAVADRAGAIIAGANQSLPSKRDLRPRAQALKSAVNQACRGQDYGAY